MRGVYPGSFNPPTIGHLAIADAARRAHGLHTVDLVVSHVALAKETVHRPHFDDRMTVLVESVAQIGWLQARSTSHQLLVDIARGYDVLIMGADKWHQIQDPVFYGDSHTARDQALAELPTVAVVPRPPLDVPDELVLHVDGDLPLARVSSTAARAGRRDWMTPAARAFDEATGAWTDPDRYERWLALRDRK